MKKQPKTPLLGFFVRRRWYTEKIDKKHHTVRLPHEKVVSESFSSYEAANIFRGLAIKDNTDNPTAGHFEVEFWVSSPEAD